MALTLIEAAKIALGRDELLKATIMELYAMNSEVVAALPFEDISGNAISFNREQELPTVGFRGVNEAYSEGTGKVDRVTESLTIAGGDLDVDTFLVKTGGVDQRSTQEAMKVKALSMSLAKTFIKGDVATSPKEFNGLQARLTGTQKIVAGATANGTPLSLAKLDELIDTVESPTHLIMNKSLRRRLATAARNYQIGGFITYDLDAFGRRVTKYNELPILIAEKDNTYSEILPFDEVCDNGTDTGSSIYCMSFLPDGVVGLQNGDMDVRDLGEIQDKPVYRTRVEWYITLAMYRARAAARLWSISDAAVTT